MFERLTAVQGFVVLYHSEFGTVAMPTKLSEVLAVVAEDSDDIVKRSSASKV
jgi:hypothetical protein